MQCSSCGRELAPEAQFCSICGTPRVSTPAAPFQSAQETYDRLKRQFDDGRLTAPELTKALDRVMLAYEGAYWTIGAQTGRWYRYEGSDWRETAPPSAEAAGIAAPTVPSSSGFPPGTQSARTGAPGGRRGGFGLSSLLGVVATVLGLLSGGLALRQAIAGGQASAPVTVAATAASGITAALATQAPGATTTPVTTPVPGTVRSGGPTVAASPARTSVVSATTIAAPGTPPPPPPATVRPGGSTAAAATVAAPRPPPPPAPAPAGAGTTRLVVNHRYGAAVHSTPSSDAPIVVTIPCGTVLQSLGSSNGWAHVLTSAPSPVEGWVGLLRVGDSATSADCAGAVTFHVGDTVSTRVQSGCLSLRDTPSRSGAILQCVQNGTRYSVVNGPVDVDGEDWLQLSSPSLGSGWSLAQFLVPAG